VKNSIPSPISKANVRRFIGPALAAAVMYIAARELVDALIGPLGAGLARAVNALYLTTHPDRTAVEVPQWTLQALGAYLEEAGIALMFGFLFGWLVLRRRRPSHRPE
jgi:hypothetical protein